MEMCGKSVTLASSDVSIFVYNVQLVTDLYESIPPSI